MLLGGSLIHFFEVLERLEHCLKLNVRGGPKWVSFLGLKVFVEPGDAPKKRREAADSAGNCIGGITFRVPPLNSRDFNWGRSGITRHRRHEPRLPGRDKFAFSTHCTATTTLHCRRWRWRLGTRLVRNLRAFWIELPARADSQKEGQRRNDGILKCELLLVMKLSLTARMT